MHRYAFQSQQPGGLPSRVNYDIHTICLDQNRQAESISLQRLGHRGYGSVIDASFFPPA